MSKKATLTKCESLKIRTCSLPIDKYMKKRVEPNKDFNYSKILAINQVFDIMGNFFICKNWSKALEVGIPKRKGFVPAGNNEKSGLEDA